MPSWPGSSRHATAVAPPFVATGARRPHRMRISIGSWNRANRTSSSGMPISLPCVGAGTKALHRESHQSFARSVCVHRHCRCQPVIRLHVAGYYVHRCALADAADFEVAAVFRTGDVGLLWGHLQRLQTSDRGTTTLGRNVVTPPHSVIKRGG